MRFFTVILGLFLMMTLASCGEKDDRLAHLQQQVANIRKASSLQNKPWTNNFKLPTPIQYKAPVFSATTSGAPSPEKNNTSSGQSLLDYSLDSLQFLGIIEKDNQLWAYVMTPDNITYQVKEGDTLGNQRGQIIKITPIELKVREIAPVVTGKLSKERIVTLRPKGST